MPCSDQFAQPGYSGISSAEFVEVQVQLASAQETLAHAKKHNTELTRLLCNACEALIGQSNEGSFIARHRELYEWFREHRRQDLTEIKADLQKKLEQIAGMIHTVEEFENKGKWFNKTELREQLSKL